MSFASILFEDPSASQTEGPAPESLADLHLDLIFAAIVAGREDYALTPYFDIPLPNIAAIQYRHAVFQDLEDRRVAGCVGAFAERMRSMRMHLERAKKLHYERQQQRWFVDAAASYCDAVVKLNQELAAAAPHSSGFLALNDYLGGYVRSPPFMLLQADTALVQSELAAVRYNLHIDGSRIRVSRYDGEPDYSEQVSKTFEKFTQGATKDYRFTIPWGEDMNHVEAAVLDRVALLFPEVFARLQQYSVGHRTFIDETVARFDREVQFYLACLEHNAELKAHGLSFCYPEVTDRSKAVFGRDVFDVALADHLITERVPVVTNDFQLNDLERVIVVSGPNQGGKTTFARTFGQMHYLASLGCPVPGRAARLFLFDRLFTLFEREEHLENLSGKLEDELLRLRAILERATTRSVLIMNETLSSTTLLDALSLGRKVMQQIIRLGMLCVFVTFLEELASLSEHTVSMVSTVNPDDPVQRTFKVIRKQADGLAYAAAIARKYRLGYQDIKERIRS